MITPNRPYYQDSITFDETVNRIDDLSKNGTINRKEIESILRPYTDDMMAMSKTICSQLHNLMKGEGDWRFNLADGIVVTVNFSQTPQKKHLKAFVSVFTVMADSFVEPE